MDSYGEGNPSLEFSLCIGCENAEPSVYCGKCKLVFCQPCWPRSIAHRDGKHPQISIAEYRYMSDVLHPSFDSQVREDKLERETNALWFSVSQSDSGVLELEETPRFSQLISQHLEDIHESSSCYPGLASFIGNTGAGKSSIIHLLMKHPWDVSTDPAQRERLDNIALPVVGQLEVTTPTSGDVHLYCDLLPTTRQLEQSQPLLYADCEGFHGGDQLPIGHKPPISPNRTSDFSGSQQLIEKLYKSLRSRIRRILNLPSRLEPHRKTAVRELFPRILYNFSDVVVHVVISAASRSLEEDIVDLLVWAQASSESAVNRALLPHLIVVLNMSNPERTPSWLSPETTKTIFEEHDRALLENKFIREQKEALEPIYGKIDTLQDLLRCSYSSVQFIRLPDGSDRARLAQQLGALHKMIDDATANAQKAKADAKMLLRSDDLNAFFRLGLYHYATNLDKPFNMLETVFSLHPLPNKLATNYYDIMSAVKAADRRSKTNRTAEEFCNAVVPTICSAIALDIQRSRRGLPGSLVQIYTGNTNSQDDQWVLIHGTYNSQLQEAVKMFEDRACHCEFVSPDGQRCAGLFLTHGAAKSNHRNADGHFIGHGPHESQFLDELIKTLDSRVTRMLAEMDEQLESPVALVRSGNGADSDAKLQRIWAIHESNLKELHSLVSGVKISNPSTCSWCFRSLPAAVLPCGHGMCRACIVASPARESSRPGEDPRLFRFDQCILHSNPVEFSHFRILLLPEGLGRRLLTFDNESDISIAQVHLLAAIEEKLGGRIPIQRFFDMIGGSGAGGLLALGLGIDSWTAQEMLWKFNELSSGLYETQTALWGLWDWISGNKVVLWQSEPWEDAIRRTFGNQANRDMLRTKSSIGVPSVFIMATKEDGKKGALIANYFRPVAGSASSSSLPEGKSATNSQPLPSGRTSDATYEFVHHDLPGKRLKVWEAARATTALPGFFEHFTHASQQVYLGGPVSCKGTSKIALREAQHLWPASSQQSPDVLLSIGGKHAPPDAPAGEYYLPPSHPSKSNDDMKSIFNLSGSPVFMEEYRGRESPTASLDELVHRLISTSFYFEPNHEPYEEDSDRVRIEGHIRCRFVDGSDETKALGERIRGLPGARFILDDGSVPPSRWALDKACIDNMAVHGVFSLTITFSITTSRPQFTISLQTYDFTTLISACPPPISDIVAHT